MTTAGTERAVLLTGCIWTVRIAGKKGGSAVTIPEEYLCDLCGCIFLPMNAKNVFCPSCGSSQVKKEMGSNELSDEDVYVGILEENEKASFLF
jgi:DNA-directed RNA polymerase subunit RPC12/RpoP